MKKQTIVLSILSTMLVSVSAFAQKGNFGLNTTDPKATLDLRVATINANNNTAQGIIIPNVTTARVTAMGTTPEESTLVYITDGVAGSGTTADVNGKGFYYYDKTAGKWVKVGSGSGATLPATGAAGQVIKWNTATNSWTAQPDANNTYAGSTSVTLSGNAFQRAALTGDVTAAANNNATTVARIQGRNVANTAPTEGQVLKWTNNAWTPSADNAGSALPNGSANGQVLTWNAGSNSWVAQAPANTSTAETNTFTRNIRTDAGTSITVGADDFFIHSTASGNITTTLPAANVSKGRVLCFYAENGTVNTGALGNAGNVQPSYGSCIISNGDNWVTYSAL